MATPHPHSSATTDQEASLEDQAQREDINQLVIPEDGYEWNKYGQKFIRNIQKIRSYFKCRNNRCHAKKRVEWLPSDPSNLRIIYDGTHDHPSPRPQAASEQEATALMANRYDLATQVFGHPLNPP